MEGTRRISIRIDDEEIFRIRTPFSYAELRKALEKLSISVGKTIEVRYQKTKVSIADDKSYFNWLEKSGFKDLSINFKTPSVKGDKNKEKIGDSKIDNSSSKNKQEARKTRSRSRTPQRPADKKTQSKSGSKDESTKKGKLPDGKKKIKVEDNRSGSGEVNKGITTRSRTRTPIKGKSPSSASKKPLNNLTKSPSAGSKSAVSPTKSPKTPPKPSNTSNSPIKSSITTPITPKPAANLFSTYSPPSSKAIPSPPTSNSPAKSLFGSSSATTNSLFGPNSGFSLVQPDVEILKAFAIVQDEGKLKVVDSETNKSRVITEFSIKKSSRLLLTPDGILITGGSGAPYQAMIVKSDYSVVPLVSMNNPRFWHCVGYIDGYPAVANGAERSKVPKVFLNTVEVYKDGYWVNYPSTNISRASACMSWDDKSVYIVGGVVTTGTVNTVVSNIEKFQDGKWTILPVSIPQPLLSCGSVPNGPNNLLIFGGEKSGGALTSSYFSLNLSDGTLIDNAPLGMFTKFTYGQQARIQNNFLACCDFQGRVLKLELNKVLS